MKKIAFIFGLSLMAFASAANAGSPKNSETKTTDATVSPTEGVATTQTTFTYYVTGVSGANYTVIDGSNPDPGCEGSESPCKITADHQLTTGTAPKSQVDAQSNGYQISSRQEQL